MSLERSDTDEPRYTLDEAQRELARRECGMFGHNFDVQIIYGNGDPQVVMCSRCGKTWNVEKRP
jgi:hypothetical protein